jgi:hypothetical protein
VKNILYWISTVLISAFMLFAALAYFLSHQPKIMAAFSSLGYPSAIWKRGRRIVT